MSSQLFDRCLMISDRLRPGTGNEGTLMNIETALKEAMTVDGALGVALVDYDSGMSLGVLGGGPGLDLEVAAAGNTEVVRAKARTLASLQMDDNVEDILITLGKQY